MGLNLLLAQSEKIRNILGSISVGRIQLTEPEAKRILTLLGLSIPREVIVTSEQEAIKAGERIGYPVVMKIVSKTILHKSEIGGVISGLKNSSEVVLAYASLMKKRDPRIDGVSIQSHIFGQHEVIVGGRRDGIFGPIVMFGLGGIYTELIKDATIRVCPLSQEDIESMIRTARSFPLLEGYRGRPKADIRSIKSTIRSIEYLLQNFKEIEEIEINPLIVREDGAGSVAVDAKIILTSESEDRRAQQTPLSGSSIGKLLSANSVAVIGASRERRKIGSILLAHMIDLGYKGKLYAVNPNAKSIFGVKSYPSVLSIPEKVESALILLPPEQAITAMEECAKKEIQVATVFADGFAESGHRGLELQERLRKVATHVRFLGPNTIGIVRPSTSMYSTFSIFVEDYQLAPGNVGFVTQSGALGSALVSSAIDSGIKLSAWISTGNEADLDWTDAIDYFVGDAETKIIVGYVESIRSGEKLKLACARAKALDKPIILFKSGVSGQGKATARSHTAAIAVDDAVFEAFALQNNIIRAEELNDTFEIAKAILFQPRPKGNRLVVVSGSGAANVIMADELAKRGMDLPQLSMKTQESISKILPRANTRNPVDLPASVMQTPESFREVLQTVLRDDVADILLVIVPGRSERHGKIFAKGIAKCVEYGKPILVVWLCSSLNPIPSIGFLQRRGIPVYFSIETAARVVTQAIRYAV